MSAQNTNTSVGRTLLSLFQFLELVFHSTVREIRKAKGNALLALAMEIMQAVILVVFFYVLIEFLGMRRAAVRGSFILYILTGVFLFMTHNKAISAVSQGGPVNPMILHAPVTTLLLIVSGALSALYSQILAIIVITFVADTLIEPFEIYHLKGVAYCFFLAWFSGVAIGILFLSLRPFFPTTVQIIEQVYKRANMIFSGKMFLASTLPAYLLPYFIWNPLFHTIDQARGEAFVNYTARVTNLTYPLALSLTFITIGMMLEHWARKYASVSWQARR